MGAFDQLRSHGTVILMTFPWWDWWISINTFSLYWVHWGYEFSHINWFFTYKIFIWSDLWLSQWKVHRCRCGERIFNSFLQMHFCFHSACFGSRILGIDRMCLTFIWWINCYGGTDNTVLLCISFMIVHLLSCPWSQSCGWTVMFVEGASDSYITFEPNPNLCSITNWSVLMINPFIKLRVTSFQKLTVVMFHFLKGKSYEFYHHRPFSHLGDVP